LHRTRVDDTLDVFACHGVGDVVGSLLTGVFARTAVNPNGADGLLAGNPELLGVQALSVLATGAWAALGTLVVLGLVRRCARRTRPPSTGSTSRSTPRWPT
jgi:Amt family ammonium transporter